MVVFISNLFFENGHLFCLFFGTINISLFNSVHIMVSFNLGHFVTAAFVVPAYNNRNSLSDFYRETRRDAMLARVFATATCPSVRLSVCLT